jgi:hypothetical protein
MKLSNKELATVLAALRNWQEITSPEGGNKPEELMPDHFADDEPLTTDEIDELCERLNTVADGPRIDGQPTT